MDSRELITIDDEILVEQTVFKGTRVPVESLFDHFEAGVSLDNFHEDFPTVAKEQAVVLLDWKNKLLNTKKLHKVLRLLLDENLPRRLKLGFREHEIYTARDKGWNGIKNGELLKPLLKNNFDALLTFDKNLQHQQNFTKYTITVLVSSATINSYEDLTNFSPKIKDYLSKEPLPIGVVVIMLNKAAARQSPFTFISIHRMHIIKKSAFYIL